MDNYYIDTGTHARLDRIINDASEKILSILKTLSINYNMVHVILPFNEIMVENKINDIDEDNIFLLQIYNNLIDIIHNQYIISQLPYSKFVMINGHDKIFLEYNTKEKIEKYKSEFKNKLDEIYSLTNVTPTPTADEESKYLKYKKKYLELKYNLLK